MRIEAIPVRIPMTGGFHELALLVLEEDGSRGLGEAPALAARGGELGPLCAELAAGRPVQLAARAAWAAAELDLRARQAGVPAVELLGGARRQSVRCSRLVLAATPSAVAREVEGAWNGGFTSFKLKAGGGALDLERLGAARWAAGAGARLRLDFGGRRSDLLHSLRPFGLEMVEQPLPAASAAAEWERLAASSGLTLAADESLADAALARELVAAGVTAAIKLATVGGAETALDLARHARHALIASSYDTSVGLAAALHAACALEREPLDCGLATLSLLEADLARRPLGFGPCLDLPPGPGLGVELDPGALARYRLDR